MEEAVPTALITSDAIQFGILAAILGVLFYTRSLGGKWDRFYTFIPLILLAYLLPSLLNTLGIISSEGRKVVTMDDHGHLELGMPEAAWRGHTTAEAQLVELPGICVLPQHPSVAGAVHTAQEVRKLVFAKTLSLFPGLKAGRQVMPEFTGELAGHIAELGLEERHRHSAHG